MQEYKNDKLVVRYDPAICIHAGECVRGLPSVFNVSKKPWIDDIPAWTPPVVAKGFLLRHCSLCGARVAALASTPHGQGLDLVSI